jgi:hypothetical protein
MESVLSRVMEIVREVSGKRSARWVTGDALDQDIGVYGDDADDLVEALCREFGDWIAGWPWRRYVNFNEDPLGRSIHRIWRRFGWKGAAMAFPTGRLPEQRLELGHIAAVIEKGEWFDP